MHNCSQLKKEFIKNWIQGLQICCSCSSKNQMNLMERKKKIKLTADIALASAKKATSSWSKALLIANVKTDKQNTILYNSLSGPKSNFEGAYQRVITCQKRIQSKKIMKKSFDVGKRTKRMRSHRSDLATCIAKRLVKKRTQVLKRLIPGGKSMDEFTIVKEALDYVLSLRVQVDVMKNVVNAS